MDNLSDESHKSSWMMFRIGWYVNIVLFIIVLLVSAYYLSLVLEVGVDDGGTRTTMMIGMLVIACVLLMGAGISRYEAMSLSQHVEIKQAVEEVQRELQELKKGKS